MALAGVGVDIVEIARMERILERTPRFAVACSRTRSVPTASLRRVRRRTTPVASPRARPRSRRLAVALRPGVRFDDVSVSTDASGRPRVELRGRVAQVAREKGVLSVAVSLSFTREMAVANAVATTAETAPRVAEQRDPRRELAESFREARSVIDELERVTDGK